MIARTAVVVMAKAPRPGLAKTRLAPVLGEAGAAQVAAQMLREAVAAVVDASPAAAELCVTPDLDDPLVQDLGARHGLTLTVQGDGDLGERMARALQRQLASWEAVLMIGTDAPAVDAAVLRRAAARLVDHDAVFVPAHDGGYALVGLRRFHPRLFTGIAWSSAEVMTQTRRRLRELGWQHAELDPVHDIDAPADLAHLPPHWTELHSMPALRARALQSALRDARSPWADIVPEPMPDTGLAHWHLRLPGSGTLARVPKQSQLGLAPQAHLAYEAACFERAAASGHTPRLHRVLWPSPALPRGALIVDDVVGRPARLPDDLPALVRSLAALHGLPVPAHAAPLRAAADPLRDLAQEIDAQARHAPAAGLSPVTARLLADELAALNRLVAQPRRPPSTLIAFDAHPGNFIVRDDGRAMLVDLEKMRVGPPALDLAHATLYTSTTWDLAHRAVLSHGEVVDAYRQWHRLLGPQWAPVEWCVPLRRAMWLWSLTWCAKWRVRSAQPARSGGEDWSAAHTDASLVAHVRERVQHYLSPDVVQRLRSEFDQLDEALGGADDSLWKRSRNTASRATP